MHFNSHAHVERDISYGTLTRLNFISTHTLTWSVTADILSECLNDGDFNSHAHVERDPLKSTLVPIILHFNSHAHVERDVQNCNYLL